MNAFEQEEPLSLDQRVIRIRASHTAQGPLILKAFPVPDDQKCSGLLLTNSQVSYESKLVLMTKFTLLFEAQVTVEALGRFLNSIGPEAASRVRGIILAVQFPFARKDSDHLFAHNHTIPKAIFEFFYQNFPSLKRIDVRIELVGYDGYGPEFRTLSYSVDLLQAKFWFDEYVRREHPHLPPLVLNIIDPPPGLSAYFDIAMTVLSGKPVAQVSI